LCLLFILIIITSEKMRIESYRISSLRLAILLACCCYLLPESNGFSSSLPLSLTSRWQKCPNNPGQSVSPTSRHGRFGNNGSTHAALSVLFSSAVPLPSSSPTTSRKENKPDEQRRDHHRNQNRKPSQGKSKGRIIRSMFHTAKDMERQGRWAEALGMYEKILRKEPNDAHTHLALARLEARRELKSRLHSPSRNLTINNTATTVYHIMPTSNAQRAFEKGIEACPKSVHLWQAWAVFEESCGNVDRARELFQQALHIDADNPFACHAYGLLEKKLGNKTKARQLFEQALEKKSTAALVCSLGELLIANNDYKLTRDLYVRHVLRLETEREKTEVYLACAWLEERYFNDYRRALELIELALVYSPGSSLVNVALARLEGRIQKRKGKWTGKDATRKRLANACIDIEKGHQRPSDPNDGRLFNTWANIEVKSRRYSAAQKILKKGMQMHPNDHSLFQAAGKVEERIGNYAGARNFYSTSLLMEPSAPTLVAYSLLELRNPDSGQVNYTLVKGLFEEALMLDPRHGPAYNAYGNAEFHRGHYDEARAIFERGVRAECFDVASVYHGYGKFELSLGNVETSRDILKLGLEGVRRNDVSTDSPHRERAKFLYHTLGMLELNSNRPSDAQAVFQEGINRCGNSSQLLLGSALCEVKLGKEDAARVLFERSILTDKKHAQAWQAWGVMETRAGNFKTAATLFKCGIRSTPTHGALWHGYGKNNVAWYCVCRRLYNIILTLFFLQPHWKRNVETFEVLVRCMPAE
jgi:tetratricopeptide (TPR) repeat protein